MTPPGARYEIAVDGKPRSNRDTKAIAIEAGQYLKSKHPNVEVTIRDRESGETIVIPTQPPVLK
jgi:hypothetical protein